MVVSNIKGQPSQKIIYSALQPYQHALSQRACRHECDECDENATEPKENRFTC